MNKTANLARELRYWVCESTIGESHLKCLKKEALAGSDQLPTEEEGINQDGSMIRWFKGEWFWNTRVKRALEKIDGSLFNCTDYGKTWDAGKWSSKYSDLRWKICLSRISVQLCEVSWGACSFPPVPCVLPGWCSPVQSEINHVAHPCFS